jgi:hypothetical protein
MGCHDANTLAVCPSRWGFCAAILADRTLLGLVGGGSGRAPGHPHRPAAPHQRQYARYRSHRDSVHRRRRTRSVVCFGNDTERTVQQRSRDERRAIEPQRPAPHRVQDARRIGRPDRHLGDGWLVLAILRSSPAGFLQARPADGAGAVRPSVEHRQLPATYPTESDRAASGTRRCRRRRRRSNGSSRRGSATPPGPALP